MRTFFWKLLPALLGLSLAGAAQAQSSTILSDDQVKQLLVGHTITGDSRQFGDHYVVTFNPDGTVVGKSRRNGFKSGLSTDTGHWTLKGNQMCNVWHWFSNRCWQTAKGSEDGTYLFIAPGTPYDNEAFTVN